MRSSLLLTGAIGLALYLGWVFSSRRAGEFRQVRRNPPVSAPEAGGTEPRIVQFYAPAPALVEGERSVICYGVENTVAVRLEPPIEQLSPSFNRCIAIQPDKSSRYTLYATGKDGTTVSASFDLSVTLDPETAPRIVKMWHDWEKSDRFGLKAYRICFRTENTTQVYVEPRAFPPYQGVTGCFYAVPEKTTTYTLYGTDNKGRVVTRTYTISVTDGPKGKPGLASVL